MKSKSSLWQAHWQIDQSQATATHDTGLRVKLEGGQGVGENTKEITQTFVEKHGEHNAAAMVQRLVREGATLILDPYARGWRG